MTMAGKPTPPVTVIRADQTWRSRWREWYAYRELFWVLAWRDIRVRYRQTAIGILWSVLRPLLTMLILTLVFGYFAKLPAGGAYPYVLLVFTGLLPWQFFAHGTADSGHSLLDNSRLITKIYFPRIFVPMSPILSALLDLLISLGLLVPLLGWYGQFAGWRLLMLPVFLSLAVLLTIGAGTWLTALHVKYRDVRYVIPFLLQVGLYLAPVGYDTDLIPEPVRWVYGLNPMVGIIEGFRWCLLEGRTFRAAFLPGMLVVPPLLTVLGIRYFQATERHFADIL